MLWKRKHSGAICFRFSPKLEAAIIDGKCACVCFSKSHLPRYLSRLWSFLVEKYRIWDVTVWPEVDKSGWSEAHSEKYGLFTFPHCEGQVPNVLCKFPALIGLEKIQCSAGRTSLGWVVYRWSAS